MNNKQLLESLSKDQLIDLIGIYSKNWLALDGVWFQSVEQKHGMDEAMLHDYNAWERFTEIEAKRIKTFLNLPDNAGLDGLSKALELRFYGTLNDYELIRTDNRLVYKNTECRVQTARKRKGMELHPCKSVGIVEYNGFAKVIDPRIECKCISCYPEITDESVCCSWEFYLETENETK